MLTHMLGAAPGALLAGKVDPNEAVTQLRILGGGFLVLALLAVAIIGVVKARQGNPSKNWSISLSVLIALVPLVIIGVGVAAFATGTGDWLLPSLR